MITSAFSSESPKTQLNVSTQENTNTVGLEELRSEFLQEMITQINSPREEESALVLDFIGKNVEAIKNPVTKEWCLSFFQSNCWHSLPLEDIQNIRGRWEKRKDFEIKLKELAAKVQRATQTPLDLAKIRVKDAYSCKKGTIFRFENTVYGRLESGDLLVGIRNPSILSCGGNVKVYSVKNLVAKAGKVKRFVLKIQRDLEKANLLKEDRLLKIVHAEGLFPYLASPLEGRVWNFSQGNIKEALQEREELDLFTLVTNKEKNFPDIELVLQCVQEARKKLREKDIMHLDNKLENMVLSWDKTTVKMIDLDKCFLKSDLPLGWGGTPKGSSIEAALWLSVLLDAKNRLASDSLLTEEENEWISKVQANCPSGIDEEFCNVAEKMEDFQDGLLLWEYVSLSSGSKRPTIPYKIQKYRGEGFQRVINDQGLPFPLKLPEKFKNQSIKIQQAILRYLEAGPFIEISRKYKMSVA